ncbi:hypothetical protein Taro_006416 [Colocasia esculenta]|uniref:RNase H type-1 domain-containing protein n=1 Tax=Colocasia esculenta TaxID=4460 RepID=A0A843TR42_COLES|nr:hypothetical protein [Colocasia esculenta]
MEYEPAIKDMDFIAIHYNFVGTEHVEPKNIDGVKTPSSLRRSASGSVGVDSHGIMVNQQMENHDRLSVARADLAHVHTQKDLSHAHRRALHHLGIPTHVPAPLPPKIIRWLLPPPSRLKLNVDGALKVGPGIAAGGGILRNGYVDIIFAFAARYYDIHSSLATEALALWDGISLCCE